MIPRRSRRLRHWEKNAPFTLWHVKVVSVYLDRAEGFVDWCDAFGEPTTGDARPSFWACVQRGS
jgi:hypothetical protein